MKKIKIVIIIVVFLLFTFVLLILNKENKYNNIEELSIQVETVKSAAEHDLTKMGKNVNDKIYEKYDTIKFGLYHQSKDPKIMTPIEWIVLSKEDNKAFLVSKYILEFMPYNTDDNISTWSECTLRKWLNTNFYDTAFSKKDKNKIFEVDNNNVTILAEADVRKYFDNDGIYDNPNVEKYWRSELYGEYKYERAYDNATSGMSDYLYYKIEAEAKKEGMDYYNYYFTKDFIKFIRTTWHYWLKDIKIYNNGIVEAMNMYGLGIFSSDDVTDPNVGVRPAIWVSLE